MKFVFFLIALIFNINSEKKKAQNAHKDFLERIKKTRKQNPSKQKSQSKSKSKPKTKPTAQLFHQQEAVHAPCQYMYILEKGECIHKPLLQPVLWEEIVGSVVIIVIIGLSNAGGLGGGFLVIPFVFWIFNYSLDATINNTYLLVLGGSLGNLFTGSQIRHPKTAGPSINYDLSLLSAPLLCVGAVVGVNVKKLLPPVVLVGIEVLVLLFALQKCYNRYRKQLREEKQILQQTPLFNYNNLLGVRGGDGSGVRGGDGSGSVKVESVESVKERRGEEDSNEIETNVYKNVKHAQNDEIKTVNLNEGEIIQDNHVSNEQEPINELTETSKLYERKVSQIALHVDYTAQQKKILIDQLQLLPINKICTIFTVVATMAVLQILRGGKNNTSPLGIVFCSYQYWSFEVCMFVASICISLVLQRRVRNTHKYVVQDLQQGNLISFPLDQASKVNKITMTAITAGFIGGLLGIGGGIIMTPIWLSMNINPQEVATTSILQVVISSVTSSSTVFISGKLETINVCYFFGMALVGSLLISQLVRKYIEKNNKQSVLILILVVKICMALVILPLIFFYKYKSNQLPPYNPSSLC